MWDPVGQAFWIFGGSDGTRYFNELWSYSKSTWSHVATGLVLRPSVRGDQVAFWDAARSALWVHGGADEEAILNDVWMFQSEQHTWTLAVGLFAAPALKNHAAVWDEQQRMLWVHGGIGPAGPWQV